MAHVSLRLVRSSDGESRFLLAKPRVNDHQREWLKAAEREDGTIPSDFLTRNGAEHSYTGVVTNVLGTSEERDRTLLATAEKIKGVLESGGDIVNLDSVVHTGA